MHNRFQKDKPFSNRCNATYYHESRRQTSALHQSAFCFRGSRLQCTWWRKACPFETGCAVFCYLRCVEEFLYLLILRCFNFFKSGKSPKKFLRFRKIFMDLFLFFLSIQEVFYAFMLVLCIAYGSYFFSSIFDVR